MIRTILTVTALLVGTTGVVEAKMGGGRVGGFSRPSTSFSSRPSYSAPKPSYTAPKPSYTPPPVVNTPKPTTTIINRTYYRDRSYDSGGSSWGNSFLPGFFGGWLGGSLSNGGHSSAPVIINGNPAAPSLPVSPQVDPNYSAPVQEDEGINWFGWMIALAGIGGLGYYFYRKSNQ